MDEETKAIRKNDKGELKSFPKEKKKKKGNWSKIGIQGKEECKKRSGEMQTKIGG